MIDKLMILLAAFVAAVESIAASLAASLAAGAGAPAKPAKTEKAASKPAAKVEDEDDLGLEEEEVKEITVDDVRTVAGKLVKAGQKATVAELLKKHGADKITSLKPAKYAAMIKDMEKALAAAE